MEKVSGRRCLFFARGMSDSSEYGIEDQLFTLASFAAEHGLAVAGEIRVENASADGPRTMAAIQEALNRKRYANDFDLLIVTDFSRLTRRGYGAFFDIKKRFADLGAEIVSPGDYRAKTDYSDLFVGLEIGQPCAECRSARRCRSGGMET